MRCAVFGCNSDNQVKDFERDTKFYTFPSESAMRKSWVISCGRADAFNVKHARVCSKHFCAADYERNLKYELLNYLPKTRRLLKRDAVPSLLLPKGRSRGTGDSPRDARARKKQRARFVEEILEMHDTLRKQCPMYFLLRASEDGKSLEFKKLCLDHTHELLESVHESLPSERKRSLKDKDTDGKDFLKIRANEKMVQQSLGKSVTLKEKPIEESLNECVRLMKEQYSADVTVLMNGKNELEGLFAQTINMKNTVQAFPEFLALAGTHKSPLYLLLAEDGNCQSEIVAIGLLAHETEDNIEWFLETFQNKNPSWERVARIMTDRDLKQLVEKSFPRASVALCMFRAMKTFSAEISCERLGVSSTERTRCLEILQKMVRSFDGREFEENYRIFLEKAPRTVQNYYLQNWHPIRDEWSMSHKNGFLESTNDRLEAINGKLTSEDGTLEEFVGSLFSFTNTLEGARDLEGSSGLQKPLVTDFEQDGPEQKYIDLMTPRHVKKAPTFGEKRRRLQPLLNSLADIICAKSTTVYDNYFDALQTLKTYLSWDVRVSVVPLQEDVFISKTVHGVEESAVNAMNTNKSETDISDELIILEPLKKTEIKLPQRAKPKGSAFAKIKKSNQPKPFSNLPSKEKQLKTLSCYEVRIRRSKFVCAMGRRYGRKPCKNNKAAKAQKMAWLRRRAQNAARKQLPQQQEGPTNPISFQTVDTVPHDQPEFVDALTIKEEPLRDDLFSENFIATADCLRVKDEPDLIDVKQEPIEDPLESRIEPPAILNSRSVEEFPPIKHEETDSRDLDPVDSMFQDFARRFKLFSARTQIRVNSRICQIFAEAEMEEFEQKQRQS